MVYTHCLCYSRPIQHTTVPRVIHTHYNNHNDTITTERGYSTSLDMEGSMKSVPL